MAGTITTTMATVMAASGTLRKNIATTMPMAPIRFARLMIRMNVSSWRCCTSFWIRDMTLPV